MSAGADPGHLVVGRGANRPIYLPVEWNSIRQGGPSHGIVTKTVHTTLPSGVGGEEVG